jgi:hypothetical protein
MERVVRSLNRPGIERLRSYLAQLRAGGVLPPPLDLLEDTAFSNELPVEIVLDSRPFSSRFKLGRHLAERLAPLGSEITDRDVGLWAWLSLSMFEQVCPPDAKGVRYPGQDYRHIPEFGYRHRHRHLLFGPYQVYRRHDVRSILLLSGPVDSESGLYHEIASRQDLIANRGVIDAALMLYFDPKRGRPKPGAQGSHHQPGTVRRFVRVLQQLDVTYDIYGLSGRQLIELLPEEFAMWQTQPQIELDAHELARRAQQSDESRLSPQ